MSQIDVLSVMDRDALHASRFRCSDAAGLDIAAVGRCAFESDAARTAVAELMEAASAAETAIPHERIRANLFRALLRCKGESA